MIKIRLLTLHGYHDQRLIDHMIGLEKNIHEHNHLMTSQCEHNSGVIRDSGSLFE